LTTTGSGIKAAFSFGTGATLSGTAGSWASANYQSATGATSVVGTNGATFYITGVQLEVGSVATPFERRQYGQELALCQRYLEKSYEQSTVAGTITTAGQSWSIRCLGTFVSPVRFNVVKRTTVSVTVYSSTTGTAGKINNADSGVDENATVTDQSTGAFNVSGTTATVSTGMRYQWVASAEL
jgi:hypothetical protein